LFVNGRRYEADGRPQLSSLPAAQNTLIAGGSSVARETNSHGHGTNRIKAPPPSEVPKIYEVALYGAAPGLP
jgi:hypothetical protein